MKRNRFSLSYHRLATFNMGEIYPVGCVEVLPGDSFDHQAACLLRVTPLVAPVMHPVHVQIHHWFVPNRLLWDNWESFIVNDATSLVVPLVQIDASATAATRRLVSALGIGIAADTTTTMILSALPFRAYNLIWNEFYRDETIDAAAPFDSSDSSDPEADFVIRNARWEKDYFTTARASAQSGSAGEFQVQFFETGGGEVTLDRGAATADAAMRIDQAGGAAGTGVTAWARIEKWREALAKQRFREARNRFGDRYTDYLRFLGITPSDARQGRPEYLGGGKQTISFSEVLSTSDTATAALGEMGGHGIAAVRSRKYRRFFEEHGWVLSFAIVRPRAIYVNHVPRAYRKRSHVDFWNPQSDAIQGDMGILNAELYYPHATPNGIWGYVPNFDDYRRHPSVVSGEFATTLDYWHYGRKFAAAPVLNSSFLECVPTDRVYVTNVPDEVQAMIVHRLIARRLVSKRGLSERGAK